MKEKVSVASQNTVIAVVFFYILYYFWIYVVVQNAPVLINAVFKTPSIEKYKSPDSLRNKTKFVVPSKIQ